MKTSSGLPIRRSIRMKGFDYTCQALYYVTICSYRKQCTFGVVEGEAVRLFPIGLIIQSHWMNLPALYPGVVIDEMIIMPNHIHGILGMPEVPSTDKSMNRNPRGSLGRLIGAFKGDVTKEVRSRQGDPSLDVWQRGYWESAIRSDHALDQIRKYIHENPFRWAFDRENPEMSGV